LASGQKFIFCLEKKIGLPSLERKRKRNMYAQKEHQFGDFTVITIENLATRNGFSVVPKAGGTLLDLWFGGRSVLDGYATPEELSEGKWGKSSILFPFPNRLLDGQYQWSGHTYQFPINNAATNNAIHGFARHLPFALQDVTTDAAQGACSVVMDYDGHLDHYPFPCRLEVRFAMHDSKGFTTTVRMTNRHNTPIPVGFGWHPYFKVTDTVGDTALKLPKGDLIGIDERMIPTGDLLPFSDFDAPKPLGDFVFDNCFYYEEGTIAASIEGGGLRFTMEVPADAFPYFQVFTPPMRQSVAFEPMTCNVNALNNGDGLLILHPNEVWEGAFVCKAQII
jgi:aldose 1-epimerase